MSAVTNSGGGDIMDLSLLKSTARRHRAFAIKRDSSCRSVGHLNFDRKLLPNLGGFGKFDILAVVLVEEEK